MSLYTLSSEDALDNLISELLPFIRQGAVFALWGDLGAGKSTLARRLIRTVSHNPDLEVPSPTFTLMQVYETEKGPIHHYDLYRLGDPSELIELGFEETLAQGISLIEWPERAGAFLPKQRHDIKINFGDDENHRIIEWINHE